MQYSFENDKTEICKRQNYKIAKEGSKAIKHSNY